MPLAHALDRLHARVRATPFLYRFTLGIRLLLAMGFIPTGMVKLTGQRFTVMPPETPVGALFETLYQGGGLYWRFLGAVQVSAGILILIPATATLGAILFFPFMVNIFVITVSYGFVGTPFITGPMVLAALYLLCWDYDRLRAVLFSGRYGDGQALPEPVRSLGVGWELAAYRVGAVAGVAFFWSMRLPAPEGTRAVCMAITGAAVLAAGFGAVRSLWSRPAPLPA